MFGQRHSEMRLQELSQRWLESGRIDVLAQMGELLKRRRGCNGEEMVAMERFSSSWSPPGMSPAPPLLRWPVDQSSTPTLTTHCNLRVHNAEKGLPAVWLVSGHSQVLLIS